ncbi:DUF1189 family protein [Bacillaceae bacterium W0354]
MNLLTIFKSSLMLPNKDVLFRLNRVSMRDTMVYIIVLLFIMFLPDIIHTLAHFGDGDHDDLPTQLYIVQIVVLYPMLILFIMVAGVSLLSGIMIPIKNILKRKLAYQQLWKMTVYALTIPILFYLVLRIFQVNYWLINIIPILFFVILMVKMITVYPKRV